MFGDQNQQFTVDFPLNQQILYIYIIYILLHCFFPDAEVCSVSFHGCCGGAATMEACPHLDGGVVQECSGGPCQVVRIGNIGDIVSGF